MNLKKNNRGAISNKALTGIVIALAVVIVVLIIVIVVGVNRLKSNSAVESSETVTESAKSEATKSDADNVTTEKAEGSKESDLEQADCYVKVTNDNSWESGDKYCGGLSISIVNESGNELKDWKIELAIPDGFSVDGSWNGDFETDGNILSITPVDYNEIIPANGEVKDIGCNVTVASKEELDSLLTAASLYIGGELYTSATGNGASDKSTESTEKSDEETTETKAAEKPETESGTPLENHGKLSVDGTDIVDENGDKYQLKGLSTHGLAWFPEYVNKDAFESFRDDWSANLIRLAMYTDEYGGYCNGGDQEGLKQLIDTGVQSATELGMYVIIDWHILNDLTPVKYQSEAESFFEEMSAKYKDYDNVIYEICNEPNGGTSWSEIKGYAEDIIPIIRKNDSDAIIIVGTPNWSQDVDIVADDPITGYDNIMYAIHFYAATHTDSIRSKVKTAHDKGLPVFVSEFSICDASGNGSIDYDQAKLWFDLIGDYNLSYAAWNISNKDETSSVIKSSCTKTSGWSDDDLSDTGIWIKNQMQQ
jgi:endoglucanase